MKFDRNTEEVILRIRDLYRHVFHGEIRAPKALRMGTFFFVRRDVMFSFLFPYFYSIRVALYNIFNTN